MEPFDGKCVFPGRKVPSLFALAHYSCGLAVVVVVLVFLTVCLFLRAAAAARERSPAARAQKESCNEDVFLRLPCAKNDRDHIPDPASFPVAVRKN